MHFSLFSIFDESNWILDLINVIINGLGLIFVPGLIWFLGSIHADKEKRRKEWIQKLNYLTIYSNNFLSECLKMRETILIKRCAIETFLENPTIENSTKAFSILNVPTMMYEINAQDYVFSADNYPQLIHTIFKINLKIKDLYHFIGTLNQYSNIANTQENIENKIDIAKSILSKLDSFQYKSNILVYCLNKLGNDIKTFNHDYFFQILVSIDNGGVIKELVERAEKEIDKINEKNPNWREEFIKPNNVPEIRLNLKGKFEFLYLKWISSISEKKRKVNAKILQLFSKKYAKLHIVNTAYSEEFINKCDENCLKFQELYNICVSKYMSLDLDKEADYILKNCFWERLQKLMLVSKKIYIIFPLDRKYLLSQDEINNIEILTDFLMQNYLYCLNCFCYFIAKFYKLNIEDENIKYSNEQINKYFSEEFNEWMKSMPFRFIKEYVKAMNSTSRFVFGHFALTDKGQAVSASICPPAELQEDGLLSMQIHPFINDIMTRMLDLCNDLYEKFMIENNIKNETIGG